MQLGYGVYEILIFFKYLFQGIPLMPIPFILWTFFSVQIGAPT
jgi:hypothetical protein